MRHAAGCTFVALAAGLVAALGSQPAAAQPHEDPRPVVQVRVAVAEPSVVRFFRDDTAQLELRLAEKATDVLNDEFRFLRFSADAATPDVVLTLTLGSAAATNFPHELFLHAQVSGHAVLDSSRSFPISVREPADLRLPFGTVEAFVSEIVDAIDEMDHQDWVSGLFSVVVLAEQAHAYQNASGWYWALPFQADELGVLNQTEFIVDAELSILGDTETRLTLARITGEVGPDNQSVPEPFRSKARAQVARSTDAERMGLASQCRSRHILLSRYVRSLDELLQPSPGSELDIDEGGIQ